MRFFHGTTLGNKEMAEQMPYARAEDTLPAVLTPDEVVRLLRATPNMKIRTALITIRAVCRGPMPPRQDVRELKGSTARCTDSDPSEAHRHVVTRAEHPSPPGIEFISKLARWVVTEILGSSPVI